MVYLSFELTMPNRGSWNGKWSGDGKKYYKVKCLKKKELEELLNKTPDFFERSYTYRWRDGWCAMIIVEKVDATEANTRRKISSGFCSYDWMVDSILKHGKIRGVDE